MLYDSVEQAAPMYASAAAGSNSDASDAGAMEPELAEEKAGAQGNDAADGGDYRPSEIPLAVFRPSLLTTPDGALEISYQVPDANTTWILRALAYNKELLTGSASVEIVASKPVMVSLNSPRFLRTGDEAVLAASVMNNTDSVRIVSVLSEIISASTGKVL